MKKEKQNKKISRKTTFAKIFEAKPEVAEVLMESGMHCFGCPMAQMESLEQGCRAHGFSEKEIDELVEKINSK